MQGTGQFPRDEIQLPGCLAGQRRVVIIAQHVFRHLDVPDYGRRDFLGIARDDRTGAVGLIRNACLHSRGIGLEGFQRLVPAKKEITKIVERPVEQHRVIRAFL